MPDELDLDAIRARLAKAHDMVHALCQPRHREGCREWVMSIPARPDHDPDLVIGAGLRAGNAAVKEVERLRSVIRDAVDSLTAIHAMQPCTCEADYRDCPGVAVSDLQMRLASAVDYLTFREMDGSTVGVVGQGPDAERELGELEDDHA